MIRRTLDRSLALMARLVVRGFFRTVEIEGFGAIPHGRPVLIVASHFNGFVDPVIVIAALGRLPRFLAKATLWNIWIVRPFLRLAGILPVHRPKNGQSVGSNRPTFEAAQRQFARGGTVAIFPEGSTHDEPRLAKVRTGAARIALRTRAAGIVGLLIVPVGITFEDKIALRSRVLVRAGQPIDLDEEVTAFVRPEGAQGDENHEAVRSLTEEIHERLRHVSPDFETFREAAALSRAAEITLRTGIARAQDLVPLLPREEIAGRLAKARVSDRERVVHALARYELDLNLVGVSDDEVIPPATARSLLRRFFGLSVRLVLLAPFAVAGLLINAIPALIVWVTSRSVREPVTKGTVRMLVALVVFPLAWFVLAVFDVGGDPVHRVVSAVTFPLQPLYALALGSRSGFWPSLLVFAAGPVFGLATMYVLERVGRMLRMWRGWVAVQDRQAHLGEVLRDRDLLVQMVRRTSGVGGSRPLLDQAGISP